MSIDGKLTRPKGQGKWISSEKSRQDVQHLRAASDAILVGAQTARVDNPHLTVRQRRLRQQQPWRVVVSRSGQLPGKLRLFSDEYASRTLIYQNKTWNHLLKDLGRKGVCQLLVEGGAQVFRDLVRKQLINEVVLYIAPLNFSDHLEEADLIDASILLQLPLQDTRIQRLGPDLKIQGRVSSNLKSPTPTPNPKSSHVHRHR
ncbi:MAG: RibD family protein [Blastochloris sp.]|nr:RibD family protein [Blastochloris sp.]